jgi:hypothetical protein
MDIRILPKDIQDYIYGFNVEHRPKMKVVLSELIETYTEIIYKCSNCGDHLCEINESLSTCIYSYKLYFCSYWCQIDCVTNAYKQIRNSSKN